MRARPTGYLTAAAPAAVLLCIVGLDRIAAARSWPIVVVGLLDEPAHLLTAGLALAAFTPAHPRLCPWVLLAVVGIDVDHLTFWLWGWPPAAVAGRPVTHSLLTVSALAVLAVLPRVRLAAGGLALGVLLHLARDLATGPGVSLWWPVRPDGVLLPYWLYLMLVGLLAAIASTQLLRVHSLARPDRAGKHPGTPGGPSSRQPAENRGR